MMLGFHIGELFFRAGERSIVPASLSGNTYGRIYGGNGKGKIGPACH